MTQVTHNGVVDEVADTGHETCSDRDLVRVMRLRGSRAFDALFYRHAPSVRAYAASLLDSPRDVDDVLQDVFVIAWSKIEAKRMLGDSVLPWLLVTTRNVAQNTNRARGRRRAVPLEDAEPKAEDNVEQSVVAAETSRVLESALSKLNKLDRRIVELCLVEGLTYKEAARATRTTTSTIRNRLSRSRQMLRGEIIAEMGDSDGR